MLDDLTAQRKANSRAATKEAKPSERPIKEEPPIPEIPVNLSSLPPEFDRIKYGNVVNVSASDLQDTSKAITRNTSVLSEKLLQTILPLLLSYSSATNYTQAVLKEGLGLDIAFDPGLEEVVKHIGYLAVTHHFVRNSKLPKSTKRTYLDKIAENLSAKTVERVFSVNASAAKSAEISRLAAIVRKSQVDRESGKEGTSAAPPTNPIASSRRRSR